MKIIKLLTILLACITFGSLFSQSDTENKIKNIEKRIKLLSDSQIDYYKQLEVYKHKWIQEQLKKYAIPKITEEGFLVYHSAMALFYIEKYGQSKWVAHMILPDIATGIETRTNDFRQDSLISVGTPDKIDYFNSGYDRGHLAPSADFRWSRKALSESYYYSNMSPQKPEFNRGKWSQVEDFLRQYVIYSGHPIFVITGGLLNDTIKKSIGIKKKIKVPPYFYKIAVDLETKPAQAIAFYMLNGTNTKPIISYTIPIDSIEKKTGIDFFYLLPDTLENRLEAMNDVTLWQSKETKGNVKPLEAEELPKGAINTVEAEKYVNQKATVCGTVVVTRVLKDNKGVVVNLDQRFPNNLFSFTIWQNNIPNFSYEPASYLLNKKICVTGEISLYRGKPTTDVRNEKAIEFLNDEKE
ncbi:MAG: DNA/RNA non-specific endonuclease [Bacteroidales bacterium]|nr:DNA/RNA non-specific endonuclease [Bacteroidales bacterium]